MLTYACSASLVRLCYTLKGYGVELTNPQACLAVLVAGQRSQASFGARGAVNPLTQHTRTRKARHMPRASCYLRAPDDSLMHAHIRGHDSAAQKLPGGGRVGCSRRPTCLAEATCQGSGTRSFRGNGPREGGLTDLLHARLEPGRSGSDNREII